MNSKEKIKRIENQLIDLSESSLSLKIMFCKLGKQQFFQEIQFLDKIINDCTKAIQEIQIKFS
jgi:hypothetical protein